MNIIETVQTWTSDKVFAGFQIAGKVASDPGSAKKLFGIVAEGIKAVSYKTGIPYLPELLKTIKANADLIEFNDTMKSFKYFFSPDYSKIDSKQLSATLNAAIKGLSIKPAKKAEDVVKEVVQSAKSISNEKGVYQILKKSLIDGGCTRCQASKIVKKVHIEMQPRPFLEVMAKFSAGLKNVTTNLNTLQRWNVLELSVIASKIGSAIPAFNQVIFPMDSTIKVLAWSTGGLFTLDAMVKFISAQRDLGKITDTSELKEATQKRNKTLAEFLCAGVEITEAALPVLAAFSIISVGPPTLIAMAIFSKGFGLANNLIFS